MLTLPFLPFLAGGIIGALVLGIFTEWALLIISSLLGADYLARALPLRPTPGFCSVLACSSWAR